MVDDFLGKGVSSRVVPTVFIVDFLHYLPSLLRTETSQVWIGVEAGVGLLVQYVSEKYVPGSEVLEFPCLYSIVRNCPLLQVRNDGSPPPG